AARALADLARAAREAPGSSRRPPSVGPVPLAALEAALGDPEPAVQASAAEALGASGRAEYAPALAARVADARAAPVVVLAALRGLGTLGAATAAAVAGALRHEDTEVAKEAVAAAGRIGGDEGAALLGEAARSERWDVRHAVARAIAERGDASLLPMARALAASDGDPLVARAFAAAADALARRG
ncbi:MAG TPA: PBS lyase, partial [Anaeromyxobacteraceae bacterium]|nr:PBS lyase [Anaeromyxobacteraceae bacterium]